MGSLSASIVGTWLDSLVTDDGVTTPYDCVGFYGNVCGTPNPEYRHKARLTWTTPDFRSSGATSAASLRTRPAPRSRWKVSRSRRTTS